MPEFPMATLGVDSLDMADTWHVLVMSVIGGITYTMISMFVNRYIYKPIGFALAGVANTPDAPVALKVKFESYSNTLVAHTFMFVMWWYCVYVIDGLDWVLDWKHWNSHTMPMSDRKDEQRMVGYCYCIYFSYVLYSCYKDIFKNTGRKGGPQQRLFDLHHLLTVVLVSFSFRYGMWRGGVLTRLIHDSTDVVLYTAQNMKVMHEVNRIPYWLMFVWYCLSLIWWLVTRIVIYGWLCLHFINVMFKIDPQQFGTIVWVAALASLIGSLLMWLVQVAFYAGLVKSFVQFTRSGKVIDPFHDDAKKKT